MKMSMYENLVMQTQMNYSRYYGTYAAGKTPVRLSDREALPYEKQIEKLIEKIKEADCIVVGGASGLSSAGGGDFYYEDTPSFRRYFGKFAEKYGFQGAFAGMGYPYKTRGEFWAYLATFLHTTQTVLSMEWLDEVRGLFHMRRHMACMFKGLPHFRDLRIQMLQAPTIEELWGVFDQIVERYGSMDPNDRVDE